MGRVANSGTILLSDIANAYNYGAAVQTDTYDTGQGTITAPSNAK